MLPNKKLIEGNYKETYKKQHQSKYISSDPEVKDRFNIFKVNPIFKYDDKQHFQGLYNFDMNTLDQYKLPEDRKETRQIISKKKEKKLKNEKNSKTEIQIIKESNIDDLEEKNNANSNEKIKNLNKQHISEIDKELEEENMDIIDQLKKDQSMNSEEESLKTLKETFKKIFDPNMQRNEEKETEEELYVKKNSKTAKTLDEIDNGEKAVQFFAMYGNTTPIKFIFCIKKSSNDSYNFRPYDLIRIDSDKIGDDYFIITPTGITHVYNSDNREEATTSVSNDRNSNSVAEFYSLSDWMYQSTLFNILKRINYFKNYLPFKIFTIWRNFNRFKKYLRIRQQLGSKLFLSKPAFVNSLVKTNGQVYQLLKIPLHDITHETWCKKNLSDFDDFHKPTLETANSNIRKVIEYDVFESLKNLYSHISNRLKENKEIDEIENSKTLQEVKNKSMFKLKIEKQMRKKLIIMAKADVDSFDRFIILIDLMCVEMLYQLNKINLKNIKNEIYKPRPDASNTGIFTLFVSFPGGSVVLTPSDKDIEDHFKTLFKMMIDVITEIPRFISIFSKKEYDQVFNLGEYSNNNGNNGTNIDKFNDLERTLIKTNDSYDETLKLSFKNMIEHAKYYGIFTEKIFSFITHSFNLCIENIGGRLDSYSPLQKDCENWVVEEYISEHPKIESVKIKIEDLRKWSGRTEDLISTITISNIMNNDLQSVKDDFKEFIKKSRESLDRYVKDKYTSCINKIQEDVKQFDKIKLTKKNNIAAACEYKQALNKYQTNLKKLGERIEKLNSIYSLVKMYKIETITQQLLQDYDINKNNFVDIDLKVKNGYEEINKLKDNFLTALDNEVKANTDRIRELHEDITDGIYLDVNAAREDIKENLSNITQSIHQCEQKSRDNERHKNILENLSIDSNYKDNDLEKLKNAFDLRNRLWTNLIDLENDTVNWKKFSIQELRNTRIEDKIREYKSVGLELSQKLSEGIGDRVCDFFIEKTRIMELSAPIIIALSSQSMQERHWKEIFGYLKLPYAPKLLDEISLGDLLDKYNISTYAENLDVISAAAISQEKIQKDLEKIERDWSTTKFIVIGHNKSKDKFIISTVEDIMNLIDEHSQLIQSALNSRHVAEIRAEVQKWDDDLNLILRIIEEWLMVQRHWIYLENIFSADDIKRQLPDAHKNFTKVNKGFKDLMFKTQQNPLVIERCKEEGLLDMLMRFNKELDQIQKSLEDYLQTKRKAFPRFYFLSNDELLKILSQTRNPRAVQDYLNKCFDGIKTINFLNISSNEIIEMVSPENEVVKLSKTLFAHENIEGWLLDLENIMYSTVYEECKNSLESHPVYGESRRTWIKSGYACQGVITIDQVIWANLVEKQFDKVTQGEKNAVKDYSKYLENQIIELAEMVREKMDELTKSLIERLIIINVHARDVVRDLIKEDVKEKMNFEWQKNLKFYWEFDKESEKDEVVIKQTNTRFIYGYEYLGNPERMVITPLTDKCYITLTSALHLCFGGAPAGPAGTGKTETTKDLSKALAIKVNVFNCSDQLDFKTMGRMFCGLAECGAWACFDEFNRIDLEVLSVIAQQIETIQTAIREKKTELFFEGNMIGVKNRFGVFITMNPGYAGRSELPDNLKSLFRPVAMMIPDYALVSEVTLFSKGFKEAKELSVKMYQLFKLSSEQLSKQKHYDFGLRGIKSILSRAGYLKEKFSKDPEKIVLIRAMKDSNLPKFLDNDIELFLDIINDLFPRTEVEKSENRVFLDKIKEVLIKEHMTPTEKFMEKINQLLDTMMVRCGNMIVGQAGSGKSSLYLTLAKTLIELGKNKTIAEDPWYCHINTNILNPKSVTKNELYMSKDETTQTWEDGIVAKLMRMAEDEEKEDKSNKRRWVIFDGPVDALWIEDMNTVLDDSRKLCLPDSSNIKIPKMMNLIFEVQDLLVASPATVSRCGMVFLEPYHVGYMPIIDSWCLTFKTKINKIFEDEGSRKQKALSDAVDRYIKLFDKACENIKKHTPILLKFIRGNCKEKIPTVDINLVSSMLNLVSCFFNPDIIKLQSENVEELFNYYLSFCFIWSLGANLEDESRNNFNKVMRDLLVKLGVTNDKSNDLYDLYVNDVNCSFSRWTEKKENFKFEKDISFFDILVPTQDTIKYKYLMENLSKNNFNALFMGETGVGKSVIVMDFLNELDPSLFLFKSSNFSAKTTSKNVYDTLKSSIFKNGNFQPPSGKKFIYFIDDINLPQLDLYGSQQPIEFLRQLIDLKTFYDEKKTQKKIKDVVFMAACSPPSGARNKVSPRLFRHFNMIWMTELSIDSMKQIFKSILDGYLDLGSNKSLLEETEYLIDAALEIYSKIRIEKLPTPSKSHYTFNLRDLSKVIQGMLQINLEYFTDRTVLFNSWVHETSRQFRDRLLGEDTAWFDNEIGRIYDDKFQLGKIPYSIDKLIFTSVIDKFYRQVADFALLSKRINETLEKYNVNVKSGNMNLVFFNDAINHFCRIGRILTQDRGNALLVGLGGSGRQSLTKLLTFYISYQINSLQIGKGYGNELFWKDIGRIITRAGTIETNQIFIFSDTQIIHESFLEDINNILNNGEVPNLFKEEELAYIFNTLKESAKNAGESETKDGVYQYFVSNVRERLRIVLCFSPVGEGFRNRCRQFPSIINCCTIDWFNPWPEEALISVASRYLITLNNPNLKEMKDPKELNVNTSLSEEMMNKLQNIFVRIHSKALGLSQKFYDELRRSYYITPTSYLEYIKLFLDIYSEKIQIIPKQILNYKLGIQKLEEANEIVKNLKIELIELEPKQIAKKAEVELLIIDLDKKTKIVEIEKSKIQGDKDAVEIKRNEILKVKEECDADLSKAKPELDSAKIALGKLNEEDFKILKTFPKPSDNLVFLAQNVNFIFETKNNEWSDFKVLIGDKEFIENCKNTDLLIGKLNDARKLKELAKLYSKIESKDFKTVSSVANNLKIWVGAILKYIECYRLVKPKMESLEKSTKELKVVEDELFQKSKVLNAIIDELNILTSQFENAKTQLTDLSTSIENINIKSNRAVRLVEGLKSEEKRWKENIKILQKEEENLLANVIISASLVSYSGPFTTEYRKEFLKSCIKFIKESGITYNTVEEFSLQNMLSDPLSIREWNYAGLPADDLSIDNAIITVRSKRWPLIIDPQLQANKWIKNFYKHYGIKNYKMSDKNLFNRLKDCISSGWPVLVENVEETLESSLEPILQKQVFRQGAVYMINMGSDKPIQYSPLFKLFLTSKLSNPHYLPEISIKVTLINFTVTLKGLEDQLLVEVVKFEKPFLETQRDQLILNINESKKAIKDLEQQILIMVRDASTEILDNDTLVNKLDQSKEQSIIITADLEKAETTAKKINKERRSYRPIAVRGSILYFVISSLANIDSMYNYSLEYFSKLFNQRLEKSQPCEDLEKRVDILINDITFSYYEKINRGLFEKDKLLYSFLININIMLNDEKINLLEWGYFLRGSNVSTINLSEADYKNKLEKYFGDFKNYKNLVGLKDLSMNFYEVESILANLSDNDLNKFKEFMDSEEPYLVALPEKFEKNLSDFYRLCIIKTLREEKLIFAIKHFIEKNFGKKYLESPPFSVSNAFDDSVKTTPLIFILSPGANPVNFLRQFSKEKNIKMTNISLGQGQGIIAKNAILNSKIKGDWVCLENCHLSKSWMPVLEELLEEVNEDESEIHPNYRLWLTSMPSSFFPVTILQSGVKLTNEPPKGLRANLKGTYANIKPEDFESDKSFQLQKLTFSLAFFHGIILERRKYGPLGWNIPYEWMNSDFEASKLHLKMYVEEYEEIPFKILQFLIGTINYGGRVTDDKDSKLISALLNKYLNDLVLDDMFTYDDVGVYKPPLMSGKIPECLEEVNNYLETLPLDDSPDIFGLHKNANITLQNKMVKEFLEPLISIQPRSSSLTAKKPDEIVLEIRDSLDRKFSLVGLLDKNKGNPLSIYERGDVNCKKTPLGNFLLQECDKFNLLITIIKSSLSELEKAVKGTIVMSPDMEKIYSLFLINQVPKSWEDNAYLSLKPLSSWLSDFILRVNFMNQWLVEGVPKSFWISAFFFPQGFNTAVLQTYARKTSEAIDTLTFRTNILQIKNKEDVNKSPEDGLNIHGLFLQGASWNLNNVKLDESHYGELWNEMPVIWLEPCKVNQLKKLGYYECPLYKTSRRAGELSTTGHSTNFVMYFYLKTDEDTDHWIRRGTALLTQLDD